MIAGKVTFKINLSCIMYTVGIVFNRSNYFVDTLGNKVRNSIGETKEHNTKGKSTYLLLVSRN